MFINGSPRKNWNTAQLLERAMQGARDSGAECEMVNLYDRALNYKGCMSCFACKVKGGRKGVCSFPDDLRPVMERAVEAEVYRANAYDTLMDTNAHQLGMFGPTEILYSFDTLQFNDYSRYDADMLPADHKAEMHRTQFQRDLQAAYDLGQRLATKAKGLR